MKKLFLITVSIITSLMGCKSTSTETYVDPMTGKSHKEVYWQIYDSSARFEGDSTFTPAYRFTRAVIEDDGTVKLWVQWEGIENLDGFEIKLDGNRFYGKPSGVTNWNGNTSTRMFIMPCNAFNMTDNVITRLTTMNGYVDSIYNIENQKDDISTKREILQRVYKECK